MIKKKEEEEERGAVGGTAEGPKGGGSDRGADTRRRVCQLLAHAVVTYAWTVSPGECPAERWAKAPEEHVLAYLTPYAMVPVFLWLFVVFFVKRFILQRPKGDKAKR